MRATTEPVEGNKVRLSVEIDAPDVDRVLDEAVRTISRQARIPGFRPGKVPRRVLEARMGGAEALRREALREALPDFYAQAVIETETDPIAPPEIDITAGEDSGPVSFDAVVEVRPSVTIPGYEGLEVTIPAIVVSDEEVDAQVDRLRENEAELIEVDRPAIDGDQVTIDLHGTDAAGESVADIDDYLYGVGSGTVVPELDQQLRGSKPGAILAFSATPGAGDAPVADPAAPTIDFRVLVKDVKEKKLPAVTDEWAADNSEFETVSELRDDLRSRMARMKVVQAQLALRDRSLGALAELVNDDDVPAVLVDQELQQRVHDLGHRLEQQRINLEQFLAATGQTPDDLVAEIRVDAHRAVKVDLALRAVADAEELKVSDEELEAEIVAMAGQMDVEPAELRQRLDHAGRTAAVRSEQRKSRALTWLLDHVALVDESGNPVNREDLKVDQGEEPEASSETESSETGSPETGSPETDSPEGGEAASQEAMAATEETA